MKHNHTSIQSPFFLDTAIVVLFLVLVSGFTACSRQPVYPAPTVLDDAASVDISLLQHGVPQFFTHRDQNRNISFFLIKTESKVLSFLDACTSCYPHKRGYRYSDGSVICRFCDMKYSVHKLEKGLGGCFPIKIEGRMDQQTYSIPLLTLQTAAHRF